MTRQTKKKKFSITRLLGLGILPPIAGALLGVAGCYYYYNQTIDSIDNKVLQEVSIEYGHPITLDSFFTKVPVNTSFVTDVSQIDTGRLATYEIWFDCGGQIGRAHV